MPVAPSFEDLVTQYTAEAQARADLLFLEGDVSLASAHGAGAMADACIKFTAQAFKATFIDGAKGDDLTTLVNDHLGLQRQQASAAEVVVRFARTSGGAAGVIPAGTTVATATLDDGSEVRFTTDAAVIVPIADNGPFDVAATALDAGRAGNVDAGQVTQVVDALFDTFTVTNPAAAGGGNEVETDDELKRRARTFYTTLRRGTLAALEFGALQVPTVRSAIASESETGLVTVLVTDQDGNSTLQMINDVITELENWRAAGVVVGVAGGTKLEIDITAILTLADGIDLLVIAPLVEDAIPARVDRLRTGEQLYEDMLTAAVVSIDPDGIKAVRFEFAGATPDAEGNIVPGATTILRCGTVLVEEE